MSTDNNMDSAIREIEALAADDDFRTKSWRDILERSDMRSIVIQPKFLRALGDCFVLKRIDESMRDFMNEQLDRITGLLRERGIDLTDSQEIEAVEYARSKVKAAYDYQQSAERESARESARKYYWIVAIVAFVFTFVSRCAIQMERQSQEQEWKESLEQYREHEEQIKEQQNMIKEQNDQWMRDMFEQDPETAQAIKLHLDELLEDGSISKEVYDELIKKYGFDQTESGEEAAEE